MCVEAIAYHDIRRTFGNSLGMKMVNVNSEYTWSAGQFVETTANAMIGMLQLAC